MKKMYAVKNIKEDNYLNYAEKKKKLFKKTMVYHQVNSPFPTLRPESHISKCFIKWVCNTPFPEDYIIVEFTEKELKLKEK